MFDFRRITLFCLEKRLSKHKMTLFSKNLGGHGPFGLHWLRLCYVFPCGYGWTQQLLVCCFSICSSSVLSGSTNTLLCARLSILCAFVLRPTSVIWTMNPSQTHENQKPCMICFSYSKLYWLLLLSSLEELSISAHARFSTSSCMRFCNYNNYRWLPPYTKRETGVNYRDVSLLSHPGKVACIASALIKRCHEIIEP